MGARARLIAQREAATAAAAALVALAASALNRLDAAEQAAAVAVGAALAAVLLRVHGWPFAPAVARHRAWRYAAAALVAVGTFVAVSCLVTLATFLSVMLLGRLAAGPDPHHGYGMVSMAVAMLLGMPIGAVGGALAAVGGFRGALPPHASNRGAFLLYAAALVAALIGSLIVEQRGYLAIALAAFVAARIAERHRLGGAVAAAAAAVMAVSAVPNGTAAAALLLLAAARVESAPSE